MMLDISHYEVANADQLLTPCLLVYPELIRNNLQMAIRIAGGVERLRPHVKTHKTSEIVRLELEAGISKHKCATLMEAQMLASAGALDVLLAYPQVGPNVDALRGIVETHPRTRFSVVVDSRVGVEQLANGFSSEVAIETLLDVDCGMHRTGILPGEEAEQIYRLICEASSLTPGGLHVYDGHNHQPSREEREASVTELMQPVVQLALSLRDAGCAVPKFVCGGTPTFPIFASMEPPLPDLEIECSPGTCVLNDFNYGNDYPDLGDIQHAAVLLCRVVSKQPNNCLTLDLGNKAVASDPPAGQRVHLLNVPDAKELKQNEEHLVIQTSSSEQFQIGDLVYALPAHICPTVAVHSQLQVIDNGKAIAAWSVDARDRLYHYQ